MDIYCPKCGEPLETASLHEIDGMTYEEARDAFFNGLKSPLTGKRIVGCAAIGYRHNESSPEGEFRGQLTSALSDMLGDDIDGIANSLDDAAYLGYI